MDIYTDIYANLMRIESDINTPTVTVPAINTAGLSLPESMKHIAGLYLVTLAAYHAAVQRGGDNSTVGYAELRRAVEALIAARQAAYLMGASHSFDMRLFSPEECDEVTESLLLQEFEEFARTNIYMLIGRAAICTEQIDAEVFQFSCWLDLQLHDLALFCYAHNIDLHYILSLIIYQSSNATTTK